MWTGPNPEHVDSHLHLRRERVFLILAGLFLGTLAILNLLGITRFLDLSFTLGGVTVPMPLAVGVLPYPITFLCTDLISELYGRRRAAFVVWVGLLLNVWVVAILWLGSVLPGFDEPVPDAAGRLPLFFEIKARTFGAVAASMIAYVTAQFVDVYLFHFWKRLTKGKHLWLRNNGSTMLSQLVDTTAVILITHFYAKALPVESDQPIWPQLGVFIASGYVYKFVCAALDTAPFYLAVRFLSGYLQIDPRFEHAADAEETGERAPDTLRG